MHVQCAIGAAKPDRAIYAAAAEDLGIEPARLLFVDDGSDDELAGAARAASLPPCRSRDIGQL
jgi:HAD superfamily hydrolase (TIGR01509 family)